MPYSLNETGHVDSESSVDLQHQSQSNPEEEVIISAVKTYFKNVDLNTRFRKSLCFFAIDLQNNNIDKHDQGVCTDDTSDLFFTACSVWVSVFYLSIVPLGQKCGV